MSVLVIDCGTTNTRVYLCTQGGCILDTRACKIGARNASMLASNEVLRREISGMIADLRRAHPELSVSAIFASGMITSEIGLYELSHLVAPCGKKELAGGIQKVSGLCLTRDEIPVYFVRGVKNAPEKSILSPFAAAACADFMRGEETQAMGLLERHMMSLPGIMLVLSSHSKWIFLSETGEILGSRTTASGQLYAAILAETFVGKSVAADPAHPAPADYFDETLVRHAMEMTRSAGVARAMMAPRFLDVLFDTAWYERRLFFEAAIAADDLLAAHGETMQMFLGARSFFLTGQAERCKLYRYLLHQMLPDAEITECSDALALAQLTVDGILAIAHEAGILPPKYEH